MAKKQKVEVSIPGLSFFSILGLIFVVLKLIGVINWSWWWVLAPFWISALFVILFTIGVMVFLFFINK